MQTLKIDGAADKAGLAEAARIIRAGGLVIFPTETVYGLGANAYDGEAARAVFRAKGRPGDNPLIVHVADPKDAEAFAYTTPLYYKLAERFMPGPLTLILKKKTNIPDEVTAGGTTVGVRCPVNPVAHEFLELAGVPVAAPSANISGRPSPTRFSHCVEDMDGRVEAIIDGGECQFGLESTVALLIGEDEVKILRPGAVTAEALSCVAGTVTTADGLAPGETPLSPGMKYKHYAPKSPLFLLDGARDDAVYYVRNKVSGGEACLFICYDEDIAAEDRPRCEMISLGGRNDEASHGRRLFAALREADAYGKEHSLDSIYTYMPEKEGGIAPAIYNRLIRAADHTVIKV